MSNTTHPEAPSITVTSDLCGPHASMVKELRDAFPNVDVDIIQYILTANRGHKEATVHELLAIAEAPDPAQAMSEVRDMARGTDNPPAYDDIVPRSEYHNAMPRDQRLELEAQIEEDAILARQICQREIRRKEAREQLAAMDRAINGTFGVSRSASRSTSRRSSRRGSYNPNPDEVLTAPPDQGTQQGGSAVGEGGGGLESLSSSLHAKGMKWNDVPQLWAML